MRTVHRVSGEQITSRRPDWSLRREAGGRGGRRGERGEKGERGGERG